MSITPIDRSRLALATASLLFVTACSSSSGGSVTPFAAQPSSVATLPFGNSSKDMLYISDSGTNGVETFDWPKPTTGSALSGTFSEPQGECADQSGDVFITNTGNSNILEYTSGKLSNTLADPHQYPVGCSSDTLNGDLAVVDIVTTANGAGNIAIYKNAKGTPKIYSGGALASGYSVQYDGSGNLFADGETSGSGITLLEMPAGSKKFKTVCAHGFSGGGTIEFPGSLAWDGRYLVIGNQDGGTVSRVSVKGCKIVGTTDLTGSSDIVGFTIVGNRLIGPDAGNANVEIYDYPKGGNPVQILTGFSEPIGAAVSQTLKGK
jgi:hypothetical protein